MLCFRPEGGSNKPAQGNALGRRDSENEALKGRHNNDRMMVSPLQGLGPWNSMTQGGAPDGRLPWADLWLPRRGGTAKVQHKIRCALRVGRFRFSLAAECLVEIQQHVGEHRPRRQVGAIHLHRDRMFADGQQRICRRAILVKSNPLCR